ncbi:MAG: phenylalanine--tRNA ligase subunit alpha [Bacteroidota bacterium]
MTFTDIKKALAQLKEAINTYVLTLESQADFKKKFLARTNKINSFFKELKPFNPAERKEIGLKLNELKQLATQKYAGLTIATASTSTQSTHKQDYTLPPPTIAAGSLHPLTLLAHRITHILEKIGFKVVEGPEMEDEWHNFSALNIPENHPARDMQDTFFLKTPKDAPKMTLRTQTSSVQIRIMENQRPPIRIISIGRVYRNETISARSHCVFHQIEALYVAENVTFKKLKELLCYFVQALFGPKTEFRLRPSFFPFTEPSAEVDIRCLLCKGKGCTICKKSGWVEIGGAGIVDPNVLSNCKIDPEQYTGCAFGIGLERMAMLLAQIPDVRLFTQNDLRFLKQFTNQNFFV